ncbi:MAG: lipopolysaccharide biosynthesis protein [Bacteroides sp.]|nr:lipopolysaccharide biosynthesis protein [Bacteroides sp.]
MLKKYYRAGKVPAFLFYLKGVVKELLPGWWYRLRAKMILRGWEKRLDADYIRWRRDFYCQLKEDEGDADNREGLIPIKDVRIGKFHSRYAIDARDTLRYFPADTLVRLHAGDVWENPESPTLIKARRRFAPNGDKAVILNLDSIRHWLRPKDNIPFTKKKPVLFFRGDIFNKPARIKFFEKWADNPMFDLGDTNTAHPSRWHADFVTVPDHFPYRFILALEGFDMASSLQWIMASNCVPVMPPPTVDGWLMHSRLQPGKHYIEISPDFSDVGEKIKYYINHPVEAEKIAMESKRWMQQFHYRKRERLISLLVIQKYLKLINS